MFLLVFVDLSIAMWVNTPEFENRDFWLVLRIAWKVLFGSYSLSSVTPDSRRVLN